MQSQNPQQLKEVDWEFYDYASALEKEWEQSLPQYTDKELLMIFPEAAAIIRRKIKNLEQEREQLSEAIRRKLLLIKEKAKSENERIFWREWLKLNEGERFVAIGDDIARLRRMIWASKGITPQGWISDEQIQQARAMPIQVILRQQSFRKSGRTLMGLCPLHREKHPSFHIYHKDNRFICFGCNQKGDSIKLVQLLHGYSFKEAVSYLLNK
jgi:hypothetical protein